VDDAAGADAESNDNEGEVERPAALDAPHTPWEIGESMKHQITQPYS
jgi:hypothetical protein